MRTDFTTLSNTHVLANHGKRANRDVRANFCVFMHNSKNSQDG